MTAMTRLTIRIDFDDSSAFGPGKARLLECIAREGSIRAGAATMGMSYRRAWLLVREIQEIIGAPIVIAACGGVNGGGTKLTKIGRAVLTRYRMIERRAEKSVRRELNSLAQLARRKGRISASR